MPSLGLKNNLIGSNVIGTPGNNYIVNFDGDDDYIQVPDPLGGAIADDSSWSITTWIKHDSGGEYEESIINTGTSSNTFFIRFNNSNRKLRVSANNSSITKLYTSGLVTEDEWNHITIVYTPDDTNELVYYRNGSAVGSATNFNMSQTPDTTNARIGVRAGSTNDDFLGQMAMFGVFSKALSSSEVSDIYNNPAYDLSSIGDLELWYRMGDGTESGSGSTIYDMSGNGLNGTLQGDASIQSGSVT